MDASGCLSEISSTIWMPENFRHPWAYKVLILRVFFIMPGIWFLIPTKLKGDSL
jgi:hypothetical protein